MIKDAAGIEINTADKKTYNVIKIESVDETGDLALLQTEELNSQIKPLSITGNTPRVGEKVLVLGDPLGLEGSVSDGIVAAFRNLPNLGKLVQITAPISHGSSGSPVINMKGEVIGVATLNLEGGQNLNFAISSERIIKLWSNVLSVATNKTVNTSSTNTRWRLLIGEDVSYDTETFTKNSVVVSAWIRYQELDGSYAKSLTEINCNTAKIRHVRSLSYNKDGGLTNQNDHPENWSSLIPDSRGEAIYKVFCKDEVDFQGMKDWYRRNDFFDQGSKFMDSKDYEQAIAIYNQSIREFPSDAAYPYFQIGIAKREQGKLQEAKTFILKSISLEPSGYYLSILGEIYELEKNIPAATDTYWKALRTKDEFHSGEMELRNIYQNTKNFNGLSGLYKFLIARGEIDFYDDLADVYEKQGLTSLAGITRATGVKILEHQINLGKAEKEFYRTLASLYRSSNNPSKAELTLASGIKKFPDYLSFSYDLAANYNKDKQWEKAVQTIKNILPHTNDNSMKSLLLYELKTSYKGLGQIKDAEQIDIELKNLK